MATGVLLPKQGLQMVEGKIVRWLRKPGDTVAEGDPLVEIETDKATIEVPAPVAGVLLALLRKEGETVPVAETIAVVGAPGENISSFTPGPTGPRAEAGAAPTGAPSGAGATAGDRRAPAAPGGPGSRLFATPRARMAAEKAGVDLRAVAGSGPDGLVIERDVTRHAQGSASKAPKSAGAPEGAGAGSLAAPTRMRSIIARRMKESLDTAAQAEMQVDVDCTEIARLREGLRGDGKPVTVTDILVKIVAHALRRHPLLNSSWMPAGILRRTEVNIGVAIALEEGLVVPVIRDADTLSLGKISAACRELIAKAREGKLSPRDMEGAGFTISNLGMLGIDRFTAIINQPESAILAVGRIVDRPVVVDRAVVARPLMTLTLSYDHRLIDGAPAARFLATVREYAENPYLLMA